MNFDDVVFGPADFIIGEDDDQIRFDGAEQLQMEGGELTFTPILEDITSVDFGQTVIDQRVVGYEGSVTISAAEEKLENLKLAMSFTEEITDSESGDATGLMDAKLGTSLRKKAKQVRIHPRSKEDDSLDIVVYKMASNGEYTRSYGNEQGSVSMTFAMYPRDNMNANEPGNFFYVGSTDPNASEV